MSGILGINISNIQPRPCDFIPYIIINPFYIPELLEAKGPFRPPLTTANNPPHPFMFRHNHDTAEARSRTIKARRLTIRRAMGRASQTVTLPVPARLSPHCPTLTISHYVLPENPDHEPPASDASQQDNTPVRMRTAARRATMGAPRHTESQRQTKGKAAVRIEEAGGVRQICRAWLPAVGCVWYGLPLCK